MSPLGPVFTNQAHLKDLSYKTQDKLNVRIDTHQKYTKPPVNFIRWVMDAIPWQGDEVALDVGCGSGNYVELGRRYGRTYLAGDLSLGMLQELTQPDLIRINLDAQRLPFANDTADVILANHMIYHIPDKTAALTEFRRVLRPNGRLLAATNSVHSMSELRHLVPQACQRLNIEPFNMLETATGGFTLENGRALLQTHFSRVSRHDLPAALVFPQAQPVLDYINSSRDWYESKLQDLVKWEELLSAMEGILDEHIAQHGEFRVNKLSGIFVCQN
ncbi:MAG: class I SAM-dependent methyltransferase [Anaerolineae bacterium]